MIGLLDGPLSVATVFGVVALLSAVVAGYRLKALVHAAWLRRREERQRERLRREFWGFD